MQEITNAEFMSIKDVAARWRVSRTFVRRVIWAGQMRGLRFGRALRVPRSEVERFEAERVVPSDVVAAGVSYTERRRETSRWAATMDGR